eukprot:4949189-Pleurochrysis_carterae.AAC.1
MQVDFRKTHFPTPEQFLTPQNCSWIQTSLVVAVANGSHDEKSIEDAALADILGVIQPSIVAASIHSDEKVISMIEHLASIIRSYFFTLRLQRVDQNSDGTIDYNDEDVREVIREELEQVYAEYKRNRARGNETFALERDNFITVAKQDGILSEEILSFLEK